MKINMGKGLNQINKVLNKAIITLSLSLFFCTTFLYANAINSNSMEFDKYGRVVEGEEILLQKDKFIEELVIYEEDLNPYDKDVTSKISAISNIEMEKIESLLENGFKINITQEMDNKNLPQKVVVNEKIIKVSIHSNESEMLNILYSLIK